MRMAESSGNNPGLIPIYEGWGEVVAMKIEECYSESALSGANLCIRLSEVSGDNSSSITS